jgi:hypothetical protein
MILVGLNDCPTCKIAKGLLVDAKYVELQRTPSKEKSSFELLEIKKALNRLNPAGHFPVVLNDNKTKIVTTNVLLDNLQKQKLEHMLEN